MPNSRRPVLARLAALAVLGTAVSACATTGGRHDDERSGGTAFVVHSTGWLNGNFETPEPSAPNARATAPAASPALTAKSPWLATFGLRQSLPGNWEIGLGVAVPNTYGPTAETIAPTDRFHGAGIGIWLKFDF